MRATPNLMYIDPLAKPIQHDCMYIDWNAKPFINVDINDFQQPSINTIYTTKSGISYTKGFNGFDSDNDYIIDGVLGANDLSVMVAPPKMYKTFASVHLACSVASGISFAGHDIDKKGLVIYIAAESGTGAKKRIKAWCQERQYSHPNVINEIEKNLIVISAPIRPTQDASKQAFLEAIKEIEKSECAKATLIVFDTLARCYEGDENSTKDMSAFVSAIDDIKLETDCAALIVHHTSKEGQIRGSTALTGAYDSRFDISRYDYNGEYFLKFTVSVLKEGACPTPFFFQLKSHDIYRNKKGKIIDSLSVCSEQLETSELSIILSPHGNNNSNPKYKEFIGDLVDKRDSTQPKTEPDNAASLIDRQSNKDAYKKANTHCTPLTPEQKEKKLGQNLDDGNNREVASEFTANARERNHNDSIYAMNCSKLNCAPAQLELYKLIYGILRNSYNEFVPVKHIENEAIGVIDKATRSNIKRNIEKLVIGNFLIEGSGKQKDFISLPKPPAQVMTGV
ncbi:helicase RepA family protein [Kluyvera sichuanensis]|uniref:helicase RepA family protein n=1 Tax=Kluyvera sichuanensis TaxID=2725494 RepID=UPI002FD2324E